MTKIDVNGQIKPSILANIIGEFSSSLSKFSHIEITDQSHIDPPVPILTLAGETISTPDNITVISGASKSGKSGLLYPIISAAITTDGLIADQFEGLAVACNENKKAVIHFDTEQALHKHYRNLININKRSYYKTKPDHFLSYNLRKLDLKEYKGITTGICEAASEAFGGIFLIVIDGIGDYINDPNDQAESNDIVKYIEQLAGTYHCPLITILHTNPGSEKERGHLGSQMQRKAESVIQVKVDGDISYIEPKFLREAGKGRIPMIQFKYDIDKGYHVSCGNKSTDEAIKDIQRVTKLKEWAKESLPPPNSYGYTDLIKRLMKITKKGERTVKGYITEMNVRGFTIQGKDKNYRFSDAEI